MVVLVLFIFQEFYKLARDASRFKKLKVVISYNGSNELSNYHGPEYLRGYDYPFLTENQFQMNEKQIWIEQRVNNILNRLFPNIYSLFVYFSNDISSESPVGKQFYSGDKKPKTKSNFFKNRCS